MSRIFAKMGSGLAAASLLLMATSTGVFADNTVADNGAFSHNTVTTENNCVTLVSQTNNTTVNTGVVQSGNTGGNTNSFNTGGDNSITTGDVTNTADVTVTTGDNVAEVSNPCCACLNGGGDNTIAGNGAFTKNKVKETNNTVVSSTQKSKTKVNTLVKQKGKTGKNYNKFNTGPGDNSTETGAVDNTATVDVLTGGNSVIL